MFAHITVFISFIYAIAISHPLASGHELIVERKRVRWSPLLLCWMLSSVLLLIMNWLALFRLSAVTEWTTAQILIHILGALSLYYVCAFPAIRSRAGETIDMPAYYAQNRVTILGSFLVFGLVAMLVNLVDFHSDGPAASGTLTRLYGLVPNLVAYAAAIVVRLTWIQWLAALFVLCRLTYLLVVRGAGG